jgi:hypothetical protein
MQRRSVDLPVPDGPMIATMPEGGNSSVMPSSTRLPATYSLTSPRSASDAPLT